MWQPPPRPERPCSLPAISASHRHFPSAALRQAPRPFQPLPLVCRLGLGLGFGLPLLLQVLLIQGVEVDRRQDQRGEAAAHGHIGDDFTRIGEQDIHALAAEQVLDFVIVETLDREQARLVMIDIFRVLPDESELTTTYRRKLSMALY